MTANSQIDATRLEAAEQRATAAHAAFTRLRSALMAAAACLLLAVAPACSSDGVDPGDGTGPGGGPGAGGDDDDVGEDRTEWDDLLDGRKTDWGHALRGAALRLTGDLPTLGEIKFVTEHSNPKQAYTLIVESYLDDPRFARQIRDFWRDTFKMGGGNLDTAPNFAAQLVVEERDLMELFTATSGNCPTFDGGDFTAADCASGAPVQAGVLTDPNVQRHFFGNMAFRRVRWVQETFACTQFPAEYTLPQDVGGAAAYTSPWPFTVVAGLETGGDIDFRDVSAVVCANCHSTMNHIAPLFAHFGENGMWNNNFAVPTPADGAPTVRMRDFLADVDAPLAWRFGVTVGNLAELGAAIATDPDVAECAVARVWNWALGRGDIVGAMALVPPEVIDAQIRGFVSSGHNLKKTILDVFTSEDYLKF
jgi:hypothetical protein